jgi:hypothetical protein
LHAFLVPAHLFEILEDITRVGEAFVSFRGLIAVKCLTQRAHEGVSRNPVALLALVEIKG